MIIVGNYQSYFNHRIIDYIRYSVAGSTSHLMPPGLWECRLAGVEWPLACWEKLQSAGPAEVGAAKESCGVVPPLEEDNGFLR